MTRARKLVLVAALLAPAASLAIVPLIAVLGKQVVQHMIMDGVRSRLIGALAGMGCKGARIAGLVAAAGAKGGLAGGLPRGLPMAGAMPGGGMAGGMPAMPHGMPAGMPGTPPGAPGAMAGMPMGSGGDSPDMAQMMALMQQRAGTTLTPEQAARLQEAMASMQQATERPLTRPEVLEVFAELASLGVLTPSLHEEVRECVLLAPAGSDTALGQTGAVMKVMILPQLRATRERLASLGPEEQEELAAAMTDALREASPADRQAFEDGLGQGFFPAGVVEKVRAGLR